MFVWQQDTQDGLKLSWITGWWRIDKPIYWIDGSQLLVMIKENNTFAHSWCSLMKRTMANFHAALWVFSSARYIFSRFKLISWSLSALMGIPDAALIQVHNAVSSYHIGSQGSYYNSSLPFRWAYSTKDLRDFFFWRLLLTTANLETEVEYMQSIVIRQNNVTMKTNWFSEVFPTVSHSGSV